MPARQFMLKDGRMSFCNLSLKAILHSPFSTIFISSLENLILLGTELVS